MTQTRKASATVSFRKERAQRIYTVTVPLDDTGSETASADLTPGVLDRNEIVSAIIRMKYSADSMEAIINNRLLDSLDEDAEQEFLEMQAWRARAKELADEAVAYATEEGLV